MLVTTRMPWSYLVVGTVQISIISTRILGKNHAGRGKEYGRVGKGAVRLPKILVLIKRGRVQKIVIH